MNSNEYNSSIFDVNSYTCLNPLWSGFLYFKDGRKGFYLLEEEFGKNSWFNSFVQTDDGVEFCGYKINTMDELLACCYFLFCNEYLDQYSVPLIITTFLFFTEKISVDEFIRDMKRIIDENRSFIHFDLKILERLLNNTYNDESREDLCHKLKKYFEIVLHPDKLFSEWEERQGEYSLINLAKENRNLSDLKSLFIGVWFVENPKYAMDTINSIVAKHLTDDGVFPHIQSKDILYQKEKNKWINILNNEMLSIRKNWKTSRNNVFVFTGYDFVREEGLIEDPDLRDLKGWIDLYNGLSSGNILGCFPDGFPDIMIYSNYFFDGIKDELVISSTEEIIENKKYSNCYGLKSVTISEGVKSIGTQAFMNCYDLENIVIPDTVTEIGSFAFDGCDKLSAVPFSENVKKIGLSCRTDILLYAIKNNLLGNYSEKELYMCLENCIFTNNVDVIRTLAFNNLIPEQFHDYPTVDLIKDAVNADSPEILQLFYQSGLKPEYGYYSQFIDFASKYSKSKALSWLKGEWNTADEKSVQESMITNSVIENSKEVTDINSSENHDNSDFISLAAETNSDDIQTSDSILDQKTLWIQNQATEVVSLGYASAYFFFDLRNELTLGNYDWQNEEFLGAYSKYFPGMDIDYLRQLRGQAVPWLNDPNTCNSQYQIILQDSFEHRYIMIAYAWFERASKYVGNERAQFVFSACQPFFYPQEHQTLWQRLWQEAAS